jgi:hypothetical protein
LGGAQEETGGQKGGLNMDFNEARTALDIFDRYAINNEVDGLFLSGSIDAEHDKVWISLHRRPTPELTGEETRDMEKAGWFFDEENDAWCHFC